MSSTSFHKITLPIEENLFDQLSNANEFESVTKGRVGNHLVDASAHGIPLVRTTTKYNIPAQTFSPIHHQIIASLNNNKSDLIPFIKFNNALIEIYSREYFKMKYHSDQALDLEENSYIGLFSCYERPNELPDKFLRKLKIRDKITEEESEIILTPNSVVLFSLSTNTKFQHKIVLEPLPNLKPNELDNRWLGITFRKSKTMIQFKDDTPYFPNGETLKLADDLQRKEFYKLRGEENRNMDFIYPKITYTLSPADMMQPK